MLESVAIKVAFKFAKSPWTWLAVAGVVIFFLWKANESNKQEAARWTQNYKALDTETSKTIFAQELTAREAEEKYDSELKEVRDSLGIKTKQVVTIQTINTIKTVHDTTIIYDTIIQGVPYFISNYSEKCIDATFRWKDGDGAGVFDVKVETDFVIVDYWKRKDLWGKKVLPKWGKKESYIDLINMCGNDTIITNRRINIKK